MCVFVIFCEEIERGVLLGVWLRGGGLGRDFCLRLICCDFLSFSFILVYLYISLFLSLFSPIISLSSLSYWLGEESRAVR